MNSVLEPPSKVEHGGMSNEAHRTLKMMVEEQRKLDYPLMKVDKYFEVFAANQILKHLRLNPDPDEIEAGVVGGDGDGGVDGFYVYCNKKLIREETDVAMFAGQQVHIAVLVIQAKNKASFEESVPTKFKDFVEHCLATEVVSDAARILYSQELLDATARFHRLFRSLLTSRATLSASFYHAAHADNVDVKVRTRGGFVCDSFKAAYNSAQCEYIPVTGTELITMFYEREETILALPVTKHFDYRSFARDAYVCVVKLGKLCAGV
jgi:hypothetical protein